MKKKIDALKYFQSEVSEFIKINCLIKKRGKLFNNRHFLLEKMIQIKNQPLPVNDCIKIKKLNFQMDKIYNQIVKDSSSCLLITDDLKEIMRQMKEEDDYYKSKFNKKLKQSEKIEMTEKMHQKIKISLQNTFDNLNQAIQLGLLSAKEKDVVLKEKMKKDSEEKIRISTKLFEKIKKELIEFDSSLAEMLIPELKEGFDFFLGQANYDFDSLTEDEISSLLKNPTKH